MTERAYDQAPENARTRISKLEAVSWGVLFIWIGLAFLFDVGWGTGLLGVGVIALAEQAARKHFGAPLEQIGLVIGITFVVWGICELLGIEFGEASPGGFLPILFIVAGIVLVASTYSHKR